MIGEKENSHFDEMTRSELMELMSDWADALVSNDPELIGRYMADDWVIVGPTGITEKDQFLRVVETGDLTHETFNFELTRMRTYQDAAVITGRVKNNGAFRAEPFTVDEWASDVFVKSDGRWLCVFSHIAPVADAGCE